MNSIIKDLNEGSLYKTYPLSKFRCSTDYKRIFDLRILISLLSLIVNVFLGVGAVYPIVSLGVFVWCLNSVYSEYKKELIKRRSYLEWQETLADIGKLKKYHTPQDVLSREISC